MSRNDRRTFVSSLFPAAARRRGDTVKSHVRNILEKLTLHRRLAIAAHSRKRGRRPRRPSA